MNIYFIKKRENMINFMGKNSLSFHGFYKLVNKHLQKEYQMQHYFFLNVCKKVSLKLLNVYV